MKPPRLARGFSLSILCSALLVAGVAHAGLGRVSVPQFAGFWEGVDPLDGSPVRLSLSDVDGDGVLEHTMQEDFFSACFDLGPSYSKGRGVINGTARVVGRNALDVLSELTCISDDNVPNPLGESTNRYILSRDGTLVLPPFEESPAIPLHRVGR